MKESVHAAKQHTVHERRALARFRLPRFVPGDQDLATPTGSEQLDSHKHRSDHHCVNAVDSHGIDRMEVRQLLTRRTAKGNISAKLFYCSA